MNLSDFPFLFTPGPGEPGRNHFLWSDAKEPAELIGTMEGSPESYNHFRLRRRKVRGHREPGGWWTVAHVYFPHGTVLVGAEHEIG